MDRRISRRGPPTAPPSRRLDWPDCRNTRDLGGLPRNGGFTRFGALIRSDSAGHLTADGVQAMVAYGVTTVIDLRTQGELDGGPADPRLPRASVMGRPPPGVTWLHISLVEEVKRKSPTGVGRYIEIVDERQAAFGAVFNALAAAEGAVMFHCFAGKDRTGLVAAMLLELAGVPREHIASDYSETDVCLASQYEIWLEEAPAERRDEIRADLCCPAERILGVLNHVDREWGGVAGYLRSAGVPASALDRVSSLLA